MVFFTSLLIVIILYYLQTDGLIYITILALGGELFNIFLTQTATKTMEKNTAVKYSKAIQGYKQKIESQKKTIKELEEIQEESIRKIMSANQKIKAYEDQLGISTDDSSQSELPVHPIKENPKIQDTTKNEPEKFIDLPSGSNRKKLPF